MPKRFWKSSPRLDTKHQKVPRGNAGDFFVLIQNVLYPLFYFFVATFYKHGKSGRVVIDSKSLKGQIGEEMKTAVVITSKGDFSLLDVETDFLSKMQNAVDGLIQPVDLQNDVTMWVNEEGLLRNDLDVNQIGTGLYAEMLGANTPIMGDIVFTGGIDEEGDTMGLDAGYVSSLEALAESLRRVLAL